MSAAQAFHVAQELVVGIHEHHDRVKSFNVSGNDVVSQRASVVTYIYRLGFVKEYRHLGCCTILWNIHYLHLAFAACDHVEIVVKNPHYRTIFISESIINRGGTCIYTYGENVAFRFFDLLNSGIFKHAQCRVLHVSYASAKKRVSSAKPIKESRRVHSTVSYFVRLDVAVVVDLCLILCIRLRFPRFAGEVVDAAALHFDCRKHLNSLVERDEHVVLNIVLCYDEQVRVVHLRKRLLKRIHGASRRREVAVDTYMIVHVLVLLLRVHQHVPLAVAVGQLKTVIAQAVGSRLALERLARRVVEVDTQVNISNAIFLLRLLELAEQVELVLYRLELRLQWRIVFAPALHHHEQVGSAAVFSVVRLEIVVRMSNVAFQFGREQHPCLGVAFLARRHGCHVHCRKRECGVWQSGQFKLHLAAWAQFGSLRLDAYAVRYVFLRRDEKHAVGKHRACPVEDGQKRNACRHLLAREGKSVRLVAQRERVGGDDRA